MFDNKLYYCMYHAARKASRRTGLVLSDGKI